MKSAHVDGVLTRRHREAPDNSDVSRQPLRLLPQYGVATSVKQPDSAPEATCLKLFGAIL